MDMHDDFFVWCLLRQWNGGLISGPKSTIIVTPSSQVLQAVQNL